MIYIQHLHNFYKLDFYKLIYQEIYNNNDIIKPLININLFILTIWRMLNYGIYSLISFFIIEDCLDYKMVNVRKSGLSDFMTYIVNDMFLTNLQKVLLLLTRLLFIKKLFNDKYSKFIG